MAKSKPAKSPEVAMPKMDPTMHLDDEHAEPFMRKSVGDTVHFHGHGVISSMGQNENEGGEPTKHVTIKVKHLKHKRGPAKGRAGGKDADMQDGGKAAMDAALGNEASAEDAE